MGDYGLFLQASILWDWCARTNLSMHPNCSPQLTPPMLKVAMVRNGSFRNTFMVKRILLWEQNTWLGALQPEYWHTRQYIMVSFPVCAERTIYLVKSKLQYKHTSAFPYERKICTFYRYQPTFRSL